MSKQKIKELVIGTNNKGKLREIKALLPKNIKIFSTSDFNLRSPKENGNTFTLFIIFIVKSLQKEQNGRNLL